MNTNAESISNVSVIKPTLGVTCSLLPNMGAAIALPIAIDNTANRVVLQRGLTGPQL